MHVEHVEGEADEEQEQHPEVPVEDTVDRRDGREQARTELEAYLDVSAQRRRLFPRAALVGAAAGLIGVVFRALLTAGDTVRTAVVAWAHTLPVVGWIVPMLFGATGALLAVLLVRRFAPEASGSGIPHLEAVLHRQRTLDWKRVLPVKLLGGVLAIGGGLVLGREGPTVQMGGAVGDALGQRLHSSTQERLTLIAAGAGAGLAAAFNAPLSGVMFVLEEVQRDFRPIVFGAVFIAAAVADIIARIASGQQPVFVVPNYPMLPLQALPAFAILGVVTGLFGVVFNHVLLATLNHFARFQGRAALLLAATLGGVVGLVGWFAPPAIGGGHTLTEAVLAGQVALAAIPLWFLGRFVLTMVSYGSGAPGGIFAPLLVLGALVGLAVGQLAHTIAPTAVPQPAVFAVVGMAAYFTAIVRAPLTGIVLIVEMTGSYGQMLPLLVSCFCAYAVAEALNNLPIYESLLERDLLRGGTDNAVRAPMVIELEVKPLAPFDGKEIRALGLPPGCIIVRCHDGGREWVPTAHMRLRGHMRITAVIAPEAAEGLSLLRRGCAPQHA